MRLRVSLTEIAYFFALQFSFGLGLEKVLTTDVSEPVKQDSSVLGDASDVSELKPGLNLSSTQLADDRKFLRPEGAEVHPAGEGVKIFVVFCFFAFIQSGLLIWKERSPRMYHEITLVCLWLFPLAIVFIFSLWTFAFAWLIFSLCNLYYVKLALERPMLSDSPFLVYQWFDRVQRGCYRVGMFAYAVLLLQFLGFRRVISAELQEFISVSSLNVLALASYFGVLGRDLVTVCAERISNSLGYVRYEVPPVNLCALCGKELEPSGLYEPIPETQGEVFKLDCGHEFHEKCIRGWAIVGKRDTCPFCSEKVEVKKLLGTSPWDTSHTWLQFLDMVRYLVVWLPIGLILFKFFWDGYAYFFAP
mmetsp:Transcript_1403/g.2048  ORF Transcript_1403/g.2048 Transcript_1403/m.2048 type:complete len:361 (-) Transcript_1403:70-1152(-)